MSVKLERRVAALEREMARLRHGQNLNGTAGREWLDDLYGKFAGDPVFKQAMKFGRKYRESLRPRAAKAKPSR